MNDQLIHHYPPELLALLIDAIPKLIKGKRDLLTFFKGCGVNLTLYADIERTVQRDKDSINKYDIVRQILTRLNDQGDQTIAQRREVLKRITQWDDFSTCYDNDRMQAKGYVAEIQKLVNVKDSFTRINLEREKERQMNAANRQKEIDENLRTKQERSQIKSDLYALFHETNASKRGTALEGVLNRLFKSHDILIREAFRIVGNTGEGVVEQIDGVVELDGDLYLVEMKWWSKPIGKPQISEHLVRIFSRHAARGILISYSGYTEPAITTCREALNQCVCVLAKLEELVQVLDQEKSLVDLLREKVQAAIVDKNPLVEPLKRGI